MLEQQLWIVQISKQAQLNLVEAVLALHCTKREEEMQKALICLTIWDLVELKAQMELVVAQVLIQIKVS